LQRLIHPSSSTLKTGNLRKELHELGQQRKAVQAEIEELARRLARKQQQEEELSQRITVLEKSTLQVSNR